MVSIMYKAIRLYYYYMIINGNPIQGNLTIVDTIPITLLSFLLLKVKCVVFI